MEVESFRWVKATTTAAQVRSGVFRTSCSGSEILRVLFCLVGPTAELPTTTTTTSQPLGTSELRWWCRRKHRARWPFFLCPAFSRLITSDSNLEAFTPSGIGLVLFFSWRLLSPWLELTTSRSLSCLTWRWLHHFKLPGTCHRLP